jgi:hypothetical protein
MSRWCAGGLARAVLVGALALAALGAAVPAGPAYALGRVCPPGAPNCSPERLPGCPPGHPRCDPETDGVAGNGWPDGTSPSRGGWPDGQAPGSNT